jgi:hypothetical protein
MRNYYPAFFVNAKHSQKTCWRPRKGLQRKAHRICMGKSEDLERKARFFAALAAKNAPEKYKLAVSINRAGFFIVEGLLQIPKRLFWGLL